jgi:FkbM family methyltransferase
LAKAREMYAVLCGAGEDVSLDLSLQAKFGLSCIIADPTPRAIAHWQQITENAVRSQPTPINGRASEIYDTAVVDFTKIEYHPTAVWTDRTELKFWSPANPDHVSHSAVNIQSTDTFIVVPADTLDRISRQPPENVEIVKLDIEGAGIIVVNWMIQNRYLPNQILVEVEECLFPSLDKFRKTRACVRDLEACGYDLVYFDGVANCTFAKRAMDATPKKEHYAA